MDENAKSSPICVKYNIKGFLELFIPNSETKLENLKWLNRYDRRKC